MRNVREQLYATKVALLATIFTLVGLLVLVAGAVPDLPHGWHWLHEVVTQNIAMALFTTGLVVVAFTYIDGKDKEERDAERIGNAVVDKAPAIVQAVLDGLTASPDNMRLLAANQQDQLIRNALAARLGDAGFATEVYDDSVRGPSDAGARRCNGLHRMQLVDCLGEQLECRSELLRAVQRLCTTRKLIGNLLRDAPLTPKRHRTSPSRT